MRGSLAYIFSGLLIGCVFATTFLVPKKLIRYENNTLAFPLATLKCCCLPGILAKQTKFVAFFCLHDRRNSHHFFKLGAWRTVKTRARLLRFSALKFGNRTTSNSFPGCSSLRRWEGLERRHKKNKELFLKLANCISRINHFTEWQNLLNASRSFSFPSFLPSFLPFPFLPKGKVPLVELCYDTCFYVHYENVLDV